MSSWTARQRKGQAHASAGSTRLCFLPKYSPDLNPIEYVSANLNWLHPKVASKSHVPSRWRDLQPFIPEESAEYFRNAARHRAVEEYFPAGLVAHERWPDNSEHAASPGQCGAELAQIGGCYPARREHQCLAFSQSSAEFRRQHCSSRGNPAWLVRYRSRRDGRHRNVWLP